MTKKVGAVAPVTGRFRPESISHFKEAAKNVAWLLERDVQKCQEDLARIYGYSGLHELQQVLKGPGIPGPFAPRYNYLSTDQQELVKEHDKRTFFVLFGTRKGYWREDHLATDKCFLVFEMGLFQEAADHRACFEKIRQLLSYELLTNRWPLIHGWPLGLKSWLVSGYTEPYDLAEGWQKVLPPSEYWAVERADISWQHRMTGVIRLKNIFQILAPRVGGRKPTGMGKIVFEEFEDEEGCGINDPWWEAQYLIDWLSEKLSKNISDAQFKEQYALIQAFVDRPSKATAVTDFVNTLKDPVGFRDRWAFECFKAALGSYNDGSKALFSSTVENGTIQSLFLHMDTESADISESNRCQLWQFNCTYNAVTETVKSGRRPTLQPVIHANGSLIVPYDENLSVMSPTDWYLGHDASGFANDAAAIAFERLYLPAIGVKRLDFTYLKQAYSIVEIDEMLIASSVSVESLKSYFVGFLNFFDDIGCLPDSYGSWCETLSLVHDDDDENMERNLNFEYADHVHAPTVLLIEVQGCGLTFVNAIHKNGSPVSILKRDPKKFPTPSDEALATMIIEAVKGLTIDVVVYDGEV